jgi:hypothetical protein
MLRILASNSSAELVEGVEPEDEELYWSKHGATVPHQAGLLRVATEAVPASRQARLLAAEPHVCRRAAIELAGVLVA